METKTETVEQRLVRELEVMTAQHAMPAAIQTALKPLVPLARLVLKASEERDEAEQKIRLQDAADYREKIDFQKRRVEELTQAYDETKAALDKAQEDAGTLRRQLAETQEREAALAEKLEQIPVISPNTPALELEQAKDVYAEGLALGMTIGKAEATGGVIPEKPVSVEELAKAKDAVERMIKRLQPEVSAPSATQEPAPTPATEPFKPDQPPEKITPPPPPGTVLGDCAPPKRSRRKES